MNAFLERLQMWLEKPFKAEGDWLDWVLWTILIVTAAILWRDLLRRVGVGE